MTTTPINTYWSATITTRDLRSQKTLDIHGLVISSDGKPDMNRVTCELGLDGGSNVEYRQEGPLRIDKIINPPAIENAAVASDDLKVWIMR